MAKKRKETHEAAKERHSFGPPSGWTAEQWAQVGQSAAEAAGFDSPEAMAADQERRFVLFQAEQEEKRKKVGRPKGDRDDAVVRIDRQLAKMALIVATHRDISIAEYLSETFREVITRDANEVGRELSGGGE